MANTASAPCATDDAGATSAATTVVSTAGSASASRAYPASSTPAASGPTISSLQADAFLRSMPSPAVVDAPTTATSAPAPAIATASALAPAASAASSHSRTHPPLKHVRSEEGKAAQLAGKKRRKQLKRARATGGSDVEQAAEGAPAVSNEAEAALRRELKRKDGLIESGRKRLKREVRAAKASGRKQERAALKEAQHSKRTAKALRNACCATRPPSAPRCRARWAASVLHVHTCKRIEKGLGQRGWIKMCAGHAQEALKGGAGRDGW